MRSLIVMALLASAGCATFRPGEFSRLGNSPVECQQRQYEGRVRVECRSLGEPRTARAMLIGEHGEVFETKVRPVANAANR